MALREFLYPSLEVKLILARALDVDVAAVGEGTQSKAYKERAARITLSPHDGQRLGLQDGRPVLVSSEVGQVVVSVQLDEKTPEGLAVMQPSPWSYALIPVDFPQQGNTIILKKTDDSVTPIKDLP